MGSNFNTPPTGLNGCTNDPVGNNRPILSTLADGSVKGSTQLGNGHTVMSAASNCTHEHGKAQHSV